MGEQCVRRTHTNAGFRRNKRTERRTERDRRQKKHVCLANITSKNENPDSGETSVTVVSSSFWTGEGLVQHRRQDRGFMLQKIIWCDIGVEHDPSPVREPDLFLRRPTND